MTIRVKIETPHDLSIEGEHRLHLYTILGPGHSNFLAFTCRVDKCAAWVEVSSADIEATINAAEEEASDDA